MQEVCQVIMGDCLIITCTVDATTHWCHFHEKLFITLANFAYLNQISYQGLPYIPFNESNPIACLCFCKCTKKKKRKKRENE